MSCAYTHLIRPLHTNAHSKYPQSVQLYDYNELLLCPHNINEHTIITVRIEYDDVSAEQISAIFEKKKKPSLTNRNT